MKAGAALGLMHRADPVITDELPHLPESSSAEAVAKFERLRQQDELTPGSPTRRRR